MTNKRIAETTIDASLDAFLHGAQEGDVYQARQLHEMLDFMLTEREMPEGHLWLTDHGKMLLAEMHRQLSHCEGSGKQFRDTVLEAVQLKPQFGHWQDTCSFVRDLRIAINVANELCQQHEAGKEQSVTEAAELVAQSGEFDLDPSQISEIYEEVSATVGGFKEISQH